MSEKVTCKVCGRTMIRNGLIGHIRWKHSSPNNDLPQNANLNEKIIAQLNENASLKQENENLKISFAEIEAKLAEVPESIGDFPAEEQAKYFTEFIKLLSPEEKATLAEETDFYVSKPVEETETLADQKPAEATKKRVILVCKGKRYLLKQ